MGHTTDFIGHVDLWPPLNEDERTYLTLFSLSRRWQREGGPYAVPMNPAAARVDGAGGVVSDVARYNQPPDGQPSLWCHWVPCWDGCCLSYNGHEKFYRATEWMRYLIGHFLAPGAHAAAADHELMREFTFEHSANGIIAGCRRDNKELYLIRVEDNVVTEEILRTSDPRYVDYPPLAYEAYADGLKDDRPRPRPLRSVGDR